MPRRRHGRDVDGILLLDKPAGITSNRVLQAARRLFEARKAGHTGALDPFATGMLPLTFGEATKFSGQLLGADKTYVVTATFGTATDTGDVDGTVVNEAPVPALSRERVELALSGFLGTSEQIPPMYSALKHQGRRLHELARAGQTVERKPRQITIHSLRLIELEAQSAEFRVCCSKGTYVRTLVEDLAHALGTVAHATALRRESVHPFESMSMVTLEQLEHLSSEARDRLLLAPDAALADLDRVILAEHQAERVMHGNPAQLDRAPACAPGRVRMYLGDRFLGLGELHPDWRIQPKRLVSVGD